jgi:hypothetical protein
MKGCGASARAQALWSSWLFLAAVVLVVGSLSLAEWLGFLVPPEHDGAE